tara:strand:+ start:865 stop:1071 length:207 start_codon:yes stop_codon:yes gene_type:complete
MPIITLIKEFTRGYKKFSIGTDIAVSNDYANKMIADGYAEIKVAKKIKKAKKNKVKLEKKEEKNGNIN